MIATAGDFAVLAERVLALVSEKRPEKKDATVLALHGDLGAGKTTFTQSLAPLLGVAEYVTSPTFVVMRIYPTSASGTFSKLVHIDAYRIESLDEIRVIGFADLLRDPTNLICIEWAGKVEDALPKDALYITFTQSDDPADGALRNVTYGYKELGDEKKADDHPVED